MALWVSVHGLKNEENLEEGVLNRPIFELTERTNYLFDRIQDIIGSGLFEAVRLLDVSLQVSGDDAPVVGDVVYLDPVSRVYKKAIASIAVDDVFTAGPGAYAIGILSTKSGSSGTVVIRGKLVLGTSGSAWTLSNLLETGEVFRNGQYYLSNIQKGKLTAYPSGPAIFIGQLMASAANPSQGDFAILAPDYKDLAESHQHRAYPLYSQPAGQQVYTGIMPSDSHAILGFSPAADDTGTHDGGDGAAVLGDSAASFPVGSDNNLIGLTIYNDTDGSSGVITANTVNSITAILAGGTDNDWDDGDVYSVTSRARIVLYGAWTGSSDVQYTIWISNSSSAAETPGATAAPTGWADSYLHWQSNDTTEPNGVVRIWSYETPIVVGAKGIIASLENVLGDADLDTVVGGTENSRKWVISIPDQTRGWLARHYRMICNAIVATDNGYTMIVTGGPHIAADNRQFDTITVKGGTLHRLVYTGNPVDGESITVSGAVFEFDTNDAVASGSIAITIEGDPDDTYANLLEAIVDRGIVGTDAVLDTDNGHLIVVSAITPTTAGITNAVLNGPVSADDFSTGAKVVVYDQNHYNLVGGADSYWDNATYWIPADLKNGLKVSVAPYATDGTVASADTFTEGDYWTAELIDEVPGAKFVYSVGMHQGLAQYYPPVPKQAAALVLNGVELDPYIFFPADPTYNLGNDGIYWYADQYGFVPWPRDWVNLSDPGTYLQNMILHFVRMTIGNSGIVTSLQPAPGSPIRVLQCGTNSPASVGDLAIDLDLGLTEDNANLTGFQVFKQVDGQKLRRGPVVEKILAGSGISIAQSAGAPGGQGTVTISADNTAFGGDFEEIALENAKQELIGMFPYIRLLEWQTGVTGNIPTGFVAKFRVPHTVVGRYRVVVYMTVFGESDIPWIGGATRQFAGIDLNYNILPDFQNPGATSTIPPTLPENPQWYNLVNNLVAPANPRHIEIPFGQYIEPQPAGYEIYDKYDPMLIHNDDAEEPDTQRKIIRALGNPFPNADETPVYPSITQGDLVAIRVSRANITGTGPEYTHRIGFINLRWRLVRVS